MRVAAAGLSVVLLAFPAAAQQPPRAPRERASEPKAVDLETLAFTPDAYEGDTVSVKGTLDTLGVEGYWALKDGNARALVIPGYGIDRSMLQKFAGYRVAVRGVCRRLEPYDPAADRQHFPNLPPRPRPQPGWPEVTITVLSIFEIEDAARDGPPSDTLGRLLEDLGARGSTVHVTGQFRGRNLFGDLPAGSQRDPDDWVLKHDDTAVWVTGKAPRGKGWSLDPGYAGDSKRWLEVEGRLEVVNGVGYLRASKVALARAPAADDPDR